MTVLLVVALVGEQAATQELTPRAYWPAPDGTDALILGVQYSGGDVTADPTLPIAGVTSTNYAAVVAYRRTFNFLGRSANIQLSAPYVDSMTSGLVEGQFRRRDFSALADPRIELSVNLRGAPTMNGKAFQALRANPRPIIGASILVQPPAGEYDVDKALNAGTNRWAAKIGVGAIWPLRDSWMLETDLGAWFFGDNDEFLGLTRQQDPITSLSVHLVKRIRAGFWASLDANFYYGGGTRVGDIEREDLQRNSRLGATIVVPLKRQHALRGAWSTGVSTESGGDFETVSISYIYAW